MRASLVVTAALAIAACGGRPPTDVGTPVTAALSVASERLESPAGKGTSDITVSLQIAANPNSVLSAVATVSWTGPVASAYVYYTSGSKGGQTPTVDLSSSTSPRQEPVLKLAANTTYTLHAVATDTTGNIAKSADVTLTTGPLPANMPVFKATGTPSGTGLTLVAFNNTNFATVVDADGTVVWYYEPPNGGTLLLDFQQQPDNSYTVSVPSESTGGKSGFLQVDVLGNILHVWDALGPDESGKAVDTQGHSIKLAGTDVHEMRLLADGSALMWGWLQADYNLTSVGGVKKAKCQFEVLEHIALDGTILWAWNTNDFFTPADDDTNVVSLTGPSVDVTHGNAIETMADGTYLASLRNLGQAIDINATTGDIIWELGGSYWSNPAMTDGEKGSFTLVNDPLSGFSSQHGVRELQASTNGCLAACPGGATVCQNHCGNIILFDDGNGHTPRESRVAEYGLDFTTMTATLVWDTVPSNPLYTSILGYGQRMSNGNTLAAYGTAQVLEEWEPNGTSVVWTLKSRSPGQGFYRAFRMGSLYEYSPP